MSDRVKENFRPAQPISYRWYNDVARQINETDELQQKLKKLPGYDNTKVQVLTAFEGSIKWVEVAECTTT